MGSVGWDAAAATTSERRIPRTATTLHVPIRPQSSSDSTKILVCECVAMQTTGGGIEIVHPVIQLWVHVLISPLLFGLSPVSVY